MNWLLMLPSICVFPPRSLPVMRMGGNPGSPRNAIHPEGSRVLLQRGPSGA